MFCHFTERDYVRFITVVYVAQAVVIMQHGLITLFREFSLSRGST